MLAISEENSTPIIVISVNPQNVLLFDKLFRIHVTCYGIHKNNSFSEIAKSSIRVKQDTLVNSSVQQFSPFCSEYCLTVSDNVTVISFY